MLFFFSGVQLITDLLLISDFSLSTRFVSLKVCVGFSTFDSVSFLLKFIFLFYKNHGLFDYKVGLLPFKKICVICFIESRLKNDEKCFLVYLKSSFRFQDI